MAFVSGLPLHGLNYHQLAPAFYTV